MIANVTACPSVMSEKDLRRQIDRSVCRALVDSEYARLLLADPTVVLEDHDCAPQLYLSLLSIQASTLLDFSRQAQALFWAVASDGQEPVEKEDSLPFAAAVSSRID
jgi:hypothetical protein